jgi:lysozyme
LPFTAAKTVSSTGVDMLASWESFRSTPYLDSAGIWTIGVGHAMPKGITIRSLTFEQGKALLAQDLLPVTTAINATVVVPLSQVQFDALAIFIFNIGAGAFRSSTMLRKLNAGDFAGAAAEFPRWNMAGGKVSAGLVRRRAAEQNLFSCGQYTMNG